MIEPLVARKGPDDANRLRMLSETFAEQADPVEAERMKAYMKGLFPFWGVKTPLRRRLAGDFIRSARRDHATLPEGLLLDLWAGDQREFQYVAVDLAKKYVGRTGPDDLALFEKLVTTKSWWDTVDGLAAHAVGDILKRFPEARDVWLNRWLASDDIWLRRTCILFQLGYKRDTDWKLLASCIESCLPSKEFFIQKAVGWALREYAKQRPKTVATYVRKRGRALPALSRREALKRIGDPE